MSYLTRKKVEANRKALQKALAAPVIETSLGSGKRSSVWLDLQGHGFTAKAQLSLSYDIEHGFGGVTEKFYLDTAEGGDDDYERFRYGWSETPVDDRDTSVLRHGRADIVALFCPEGDAGWSETVLLIDRVRDLLKDAAEKGLAHKRAA